MGDHANDHADCSADACLTAKLRYWRQNGAPAVHYPYGGRATFHGPTIKERADRQVAEAASVGIGAVPKTNIYTGR